MRGALRQKLHDEGKPGIIPAYAGSTETMPPTAFGSQDHPRVCGEHSHKFLERQSLEGSSPRMRGALDRSMPPKIGQGIIPAYAGSTH